MRVEYEPFSSEHWEDPYPVYAQLREHDPVHWAPKQQTWCITRHSDVVHVLEKASEGKYVWHFQELYDGDERKGNKHAESDEISIRYIVLKKLPWYCVVWL